MGLSHDKAEPLLIVDNLEKVLCAPRCARNKKRSDGLAGSLFRNSTRVDAGSGR